MSARPRKVNADWRRRLEKGDEAELLKWVDQSGLERAARIIAALADAAGERGQPEKLNIRLLLRIARLKQQQPHRTLHAIAREVAREESSRPSMITVESLVSKLERDFKKRRHTWMTLAGEYHDESGAETADEFRVLARIVELLPSKMDLFDLVLADAKRRGRDEERLVRRLGRERAEPLLVKAIERQAASSFVPRARGVKKIPRNFFDLIEPELERFRLSRQLPAPRRRPVGRK